MKYVINIGRLFPNQLAFCRSQATFIGFGGARGGGKTHVLCSKMAQLAWLYPGIRICIVRRKYVNLQVEIIPKLKSILGDSVIFNKKEASFVFPNGENGSEGSIIILQHYKDAGARDNFQGANYDIVAMDEATQFEEEMFNVLTMCNRVSGRVKDPDFRARMYLTCNPGGVGHAWFKRLFIDKKYKDSEDPSMYDFIPSRVYDNEYIMKHDPLYVKKLEALPEKLRKAMLDGDWETFEGVFFPEFDETVHVYEEGEIEIKQEWKKIRTRDFGLDATACYWIAQDELGTFYVYREFFKSDLTVIESGLKINELTRKGEIISMDLVPHDMYNRQSQTGRSAVEMLINHCGQLPVRANNDFEMGCMYLREFFKIDSLTRKPKLMISSQCDNLINSLKIIQTDEKRPNVYAKNPHHLTHSVDAIRQFAVSYYVPYIPKEIKKLATEFEYTKFALGIYDDYETPQEKELEIPMSEGGWFMW